MQDKLFLDLNSTKKIKLQNIVFVVSYMGFWQAHSSVEKAGLMGLVKMRLLPCDGNLSLRGDTLKESIKRDREKGLIPFFVSKDLALLSILPLPFIRGYILFFSCYCLLHL